MKYRNLEDKQLYRSRNGLFLGVCRGVADYLEFPVFWLRVITVILTILSAGWIGFVIYILAAMFLKPEPVVPFETVEDQEFYNSYVSSRSLALQRLKKTFESLERRIARMENVVTARDYDWESRLKSGRRSSPHASS